MRLCVCTCDPDWADEEEIAVVSSSSTVSNATVSLLLVGRLEAPVPVFPIEVDWSDAVRAEDGFLSTRAFFISERISTDKTGTGMNAMSQFKNTHVRFTHKQSESRGEGQSSDLVCTAARA